MNLYDRKTQLLMAVVLPAVVQVAELRSLGAPRLPHPGIGRAGVMLGSAHHARCVK